MSFPLALRRISDAVDRGVVLLCAVLVAAMLSVSLVGIFFQFVLGTPLTWPHPTTRMMLPWLAMLSLTAAFKRGEHIAILMAIRRLSPSRLRWVRIGHLVVVSAFALAMAWYGIGYFENATQLFMVSAAIQVSHRWLAASVPVCGLVMCLHLLSGLALVEQKEFVPEEDE